MLTLYMYNVFLFLIFKHWHCLTGYNFRIPVNMYCLLAFLTVATMGLSNTSVGYLNYPTQVIFKCCKLIPVMIGGILIQGIYFFWFILIDYYYYCNILECSTFITP